MRTCGIRHELERLGWSDGRNVRIDWVVTPSVIGKRMKLGFAVKFRSLVASQEDPAPWGPYP
jgi:hypothetical protein